jgi:ABC-2 type transport system permease protein
MKGFLNHLLISIKLNFRNPQALVFGYVVPVFFLFAYGTLFADQSKRAPLTRQLGQLLTISVLGGACFGMPIAFVTERERGVWRRYRLAPLPTGGFVASMMTSRFLLVLSSAALQLALAFGVYKTPAPARPGQLFVAFIFVAFALLALGLVIGMVANSAGAVQALGQSLFLPMIIIGGVGVPLSQLPLWARHVAAFLPGSYAVKAIDSSVIPSATGLFGPPHNAFNIVALGLIGAAGVLAGSKLFRWENQQPLGKRAGWWIFCAVAVWAAVGLCAEWLHIIGK